MKKQYRKSFSLVELMVVIAIIGILSVVALPLYKTYIISSKFMEIISLIGTYKIEAAQAFNVTGVPPVNRTDVINTALVYKVEFWQNNGIEFIVVYPQNFYPEHRAGVGSDRFILRGEVQNDILIWICCIHATIGIPAKYLPSNCQTICIGT